MAAIYAVTVLSMLALVPRNANAQGLYYGNRCHLLDAPLELREAAADLVISGKVLSIHTNTYNSSYYCSINIYRVMKGEALVTSLLGLSPSTKLLYDQVVEISGFGNEDICDSHVSVGDTRIFLASYHRYTNFTLNSSIARVGVRALRKKLAGK